MWRPPETAPKDGTRVIIRIVDLAGESILGASWCDECAKERGPYGRFGWDPDRGISGSQIAEDVVTGWMPIPDDSNL